MEFLSNEWITALDDAARRRVVPDDDPLAGLSITLEQEVDHMAWRMIVERGAVSVRRSVESDEPADVRLTCTTDVARSIFLGEMPPIEAFMNGTLRIGGNVAALMDARPALDALGDVFAAVEARSH